MAKNLWTDKDVSFLKKNFKSMSKGDMADILGRSVKSVVVKCTRLKLSLFIIYRENINCLGCNKEINSLKSHKRKFCSRSCSVSYNNSIKVISETQKENVRQSLRKYHTNKNKNKEVNNLNKKNRVVEYKECKNCNSQISKARRTICDTCRISYYSYYRPSAAFKFSIKEFGFLFSKEEIDLISLHGMYSASNRGGNICGVSRDHKYSVKSGFKNKIHPNIISHPANCELMLHKQNNKKNSDNSISYQDLKSNILISELINPILGRDILSLI